MSSSKFVQIGDRWVPAEYAYDLDTSYDEDESIPHYHIVDHGDHVHYVGEDGTQIDDYPEYEDEESFVIRRDPRNPHLWMSQREYEKRLRAARIGQTVATGGGALVGFGLGGPLGAGIGAAAGNLVGGAITPTPGVPRTFGRAAGNAVISGLAGGLSPVILPFMAPIAAAGGAGLAGYFTSLR